MSDLEPAEDDLYPGRALVGGLLLVTFGAAAGALYGVGVSDGMRLLQAAIGGAVGSAVVALLIAAWSRRWDAGSLVFHAVVAALGGAVAIVPVALLAGLYAQGIG